MLRPLMLLAATAIAVSVVSAQAPPEASATAEREPLRVAANVEAEASLARRAPLVLTLSRPLTPADGRLAIFLGPADLTAMFTPSGRTLRYEPGAVPLPPGEAELRIYRVPEGARADVGWEELIRVPVRVQRRGGFEQVGFEPNVSLNNKGQVGEGTVPAPEPPPEHRIYQDFSGQFGGTLRLARRGWAVEAQADAVGVSYRNEALRYNELEERAPRLDLSRYLVQASRGPATLHLGHVQHGRHPLLADGFNSRGTMASAQLGAQVDVSVAAMNGSRIVGWANPLGLNEPDHRVLSGTVGLDLLPERPGGFRVEASVVDGAVRPRNGIGRAEVVDAERSRGLGVRLLAAPPGRRFRLDAGVAGSRYTNPTDPALAAGGAIVPVTQTMRVAHYLDAGLDVLEGLALWRGVEADLGVHARRGRTPPLYQTVAAYVRPDVLQHAAEVQGRLGALQVQAAHTRATDNLDGIASILTTETRQHAARAAAALADVLRLGQQPAAPLLPSVHYAFARTHQFGQGLPANGGFSPSHVPDQVSTQHEAAADWDLWKARAGYRFSHAFQDNRQEGRADADFRTVTHGVTFSLRPHERADVAVDLDLERATSLAEARTDGTRRMGLRADLRPIERLALSGQFAPTRTTDNFDLRLRTHERASLEAAWSFTLAGDARQLARGQAFVRYSRQSTFSRDLERERQDERRTWAINTGVSVTLF